MGLVSSRIGPGPHVAGGLSGVSPGLALLSGAEFFIDASLSAVSGGKLLNLGTGGSALDATFGSTTGTDTNDPTLLGHAGVNYLYLPGVTGNYASTPDSAAVSVTGDMEVVLRVGMDDWTPASQQTLIAKYGSAGNISWALAVNGGGVTLPTSVDGTATQIANSTGGALALTDGVTYWVRATVQPNTPGGSKTTRFYYAADQTTEPSSWTQIGSDVVTAGGTSIFDSTTAVEIGSLLTGTQTLSGKVFRAIIRNGIGGTTVFDADFTRGITSGGQTSFTESSANAATVTINRPTSGRKAVAVVRPVLLLGTDDYLEVAHSSLVDFGASDSFTALAVARLWGTPVNNGRMIQKGLVTSPRWLLYSNATSVQPTMQVNDNVTLAGQSSVVGTIGNLTLHGGVVDRTAQTVRAYINSNGSTTVSTAAVGSTANTDPMRVGAVPGSAASSDMEFVAAAVFRRALSAAEIASIVSFYGAA